MNNLISDGCGPERYSLRFAVDIPHAAKFSPGSDDNFVVLSYFDREVQLQPVPFGLMIFASDFASESEAKSFGDRLRVACQLLSISKSVPVFTDREPFPVFETENLLESLAPDARLVDGQALQMSYTIIPEHKVVMNYGELRGNMTRIVSVKYFSEAFKQVEARGVKTDFRFIEAIDIACNFWSIACVQQSEIVSTVNIVAALEVLAAGVGIKGVREAAVRGLFEAECLMIQSNYPELPKGHSTVSFCKELFRRRNELIHTGRSPNTSYEVSLVARDICKALILSAIEKNYFAR